MSRRAREGPPTSPTIWKGIMSRGQTRGIPYCLTEVAEPMWRLFLSTVLTSGCRRRRVSDRPYLLWCFEFEKFVQKAGKWHAERSTSPLVDHHRLQGRPASRRRRRWGCEKAQQWWYWRARRTGRANNDHVPSILGACRLATRPGLSSMPWCAAPSPNASGAGLWGLATGRHLGSETDSRCIVPGQAWNVLGGLGMVPTDNRDVAQFVGKG